MPVLKAQSPTTSSHESIAATQPHTKSAAIDIIPNGHVRRQRLSTSECAASPPDLSESPLPCCFPAGCSHANIDSTDPPEGAVRLVCSNTACPYSPFMHSSCFASLEEELMTLLRAHGRAKSWSEKQRKQNMWSKRGYDLIFKHCGCRCRRGMLKKDQDYVPLNTEERGRRQKKRSDSKHHPLPSPVSKLSSSASSSHRVPNGLNRLGVHSRSSRNSDSVSSDVAIATVAQPFRHRTVEDYKVFHETLPKHLVNSFHIKMEDDGYGAGDDTRSFVLSSLACSRLNSVHCVLCAAVIEVYDRYPLINGTFYLSRRTNNDTTIEVESRDEDPVYLSAVCLQCLSGRNKVYCRFCEKPWEGGCHQIGTMYYFDLFATLPCCPVRMACSSCQQTFPDVQKMSFSQYSSRLACPSCHVNDFHLAKPLNTYLVKKQAK